MMQASKSRPTQRRWMQVCCQWSVVFALALMPAITQAARSENSDPEIVDARLEGYTSSVGMPEQSTGLTWLIFVVLIVFVGAGLFKDAKRTHLD